jgi:hypothetical protein
MDKAGQESFEDHTERRRTPRRKVLKGVQIVALDKRSAIDCELSPNLGDERGQAAA